MFEIGKKYGKDVSLNQDFAEGADDMGIEYLV